MTHLPASVLSGGAILRRAAFGSRSSGAVTEPPGYHDAIVASENALRFPDRAGLRLASLSWRNCIAVQQRHQALRQWILPGDPSVCIVTTDILDIVPDDWGPKVGGDGTQATLTRRGADSIRFRAPAHLAIILLTPQPSRVAALGTDRRTAFAAPVGSLELIPADADFYGEWSTPKENILVGMAPERLAEAALREFGNASFELRPPPRARPDHRALQMADLLRAEISRGEHASGLYIGSLLAMLSVHILREYSSIGENAQGFRQSMARGGLAPGTWRLVREYVHEHLAEALTVRELAAIAGLSPSHFLRAFRETAGQPPHRYVRELRVSRAEHMIRETDFPLKTIARITGFSSSSHLISTMRELRSVTPGAVRRAKVAGGTVQGGGIK